MREHRPRKLVQGWDWVDQDGKDPSLLGLVGSREGERAV